MTVGSLGTEMAVKGLLPAHTWLCSPSRREEGHIIGAKENVLTLFSVQN